MPKVKSPPLKSPSKRPGLAKTREKTRRDVRTAARTRRRVSLAAAAVAGTPLAAVARAEGISRTWASQEAHAPGTQILIADLLDAHYDRVKGLVARSLEVIADALEAKKTAAIEGLGVVDLGPDHYTRLAAARRLLQFTLAGRKSTEDPTDDRGGLVTMETLQMIYNRTVKVAK